MTVTTPAAALEKVAVYSDDEIHIEHFKSGGETLVITFDPILYDWTKPPFGLDFLRKQGADVLAVRKKRENFYQPLSRDTFLEVAGPVVAGYDRVIGYGSSLGAYCALYFCSQLDSEVVATSPRISIHPRFGVSHWQMKVPFTHTTFDQLPPPRCRATIVYDPKDFMDGVYIPQEILPYFRAAREIRAPYSGHPSGHFLNEIGYLGPLMRAVIGDEPPPPFQRLKKERSWSYLQGLAVACYERGKQRWALALIDRSLAINPKNPVAHRTRARILLAVGAAEQAKAAIDTARELNGDDETAKRLTAEIYTALGMTAELAAILPEHAAAMAAANAEEMRSQAVSKPGLRTRLRQLSKGLVKRLRVLPTQAGGWSRVVPIETLKPRRAPATAAGQVEPPSVAARAAVKIAIVANCQHRPLTQIARACISQDGVEVISVSHLDLEADPGRAGRILDTADVVVMQPLSDRFGRFSSAAIKAQRGDRCVVVPNLFFYGYHPESTYSGSEGARVVSPIGDYHSAAVILCRENGLSADDAVRLLQSEEFFIHAGLVSIPQESLAALRGREQQCDIAVSDYVEAHFKTRPLFYTVNHPSAGLVQELVLRVLARLEIPHRRLDEHVLRSPLLEGPIYPVHQAYAALAGLAFEQPFFIRAANSGGSSLSLEQFVSGSYAAYSLIKGVLEVRSPYGARIRAYLESL